MNKRLRLGGAIAALALLATSLTACTPTLKAGDGKLTMVGSLSGAAADNLQTELAEWGKRSGVQIRYTTLTDFNGQIRSELAGENRPDLVLFDSPATVLAMKNRNPVALEKLVELKPYTQTLVNGSAELARSQGDTYGLPIMATVGSAVWYNPSQFEKYGYQLPTSDRQLMNLVRQIRRDGHGYPWCAGDSQGLSSGDATGDWLEDFALRYNGELFYTKWWRQDVAFNSVEIKQAAIKVADYLLTPGNVQGGGEGIAKSTPAQAASKLFVTGKANGQCFMYRGGGEVEQVLPAQIRKQIAKSKFANISVFPLPDLTRKSRSVIGTARYLTAFTKDADVATALEFLLSDDFGRYGLAHKGSFVSPHTSFDTTKYRNAIRKRLGEIMATATQFGFDASDLLPAELGSQLEPQTLLTWMNGESTLEAALDTIQAAWNQPSKSRQ